MTPDLLLDVAVLLYLETGRPNAASRTDGVLAPTTWRVLGNLRNRLLRAMIDEAVEAN
ncbi:MAG: hypothetical protein P8L45_03995 [Longimicrobiales bacterium]|nr:hypothetical protein [Longimicrobiales bacterium]